jgi:hypothetical protein
MSDGNTEAQVLPETITLPSGGMVWFRDVETLTGKDVKWYRRATFGDGTRGENMNATSEALMYLLVVRWEFPYLPGLPLPSQDQQVGDLLHWRDLVALEDAMAPVMPLLRGQGVPRPGADTTPGSPTPPGSE